MKNIAYIIGAVVLLLLLFQKKIADVVNKIRDVRSVGGLSQVSNDKNQVVKAPKKPTVAKPKSATNSYYGEYGFNTPLFNDMKKQAQTAKELEDRNKRNYPLIYTAPRYF